MPTSDEAFDPRVQLAQRERLSILLIWTGLGILESSKAWIARRFTPQPLDWTTVLAGNMPWWLMWAALTPPVIWLARRVRPERGWLTFGTTHFLAASLLSLLHHAVVGTLYFYTHTRGTVLPLGVGLGQATPALQFRNFFTGYFVLNVLTYFAILAAYYGLEFYKRYREGELRATRLEAGIQRARLAALRMELNPHFLFNTLNAVTGLVRSRDDAGAVRMLARLSELLRTTLEQGNDPEIPLEKELETLSTYLEIERIRFGERLEVEVTAEAVARLALVPPFILQPLVENAIKHGVARHSGHGRVRVSAISRAGELELSVTNTGTVESSLMSVVDQDGGIGLANTRERLAELYGSRGNFALEMLPDGGARAVIHLPLRRESGADAALVETAGAR